MRWVVFLRAVNVGGANRCQPAVIAKQLAKFDVTNIGAVGTFVAREDVSESALRDAITRQLPFQCEIMICQAADILKLAQQDPLAGERGRDIDAHASILAKPLSKVPKLPIYVPSRQTWEVKIARVLGPAVICLRRKGSRSYPNEIVEKQFGIPATTRSWNTIEKIAKLLNE